MFDSRNRIRASPEEQAYRQSAAVIGWQVMAVCAGLVAVGGAMILAFVFWQATPTEASKPPQPNEIALRLDPGELLLALALLAAGSVLCAGLAARIIARRAVRPLDAAFRLQRHFVADASHELRTPLAVLAARLQQLTALTPPEDRRRPVLEELRQDVRIMAEVVDALLGESAGSAETPGTASLDGTILEVTSALRGIAEQFGIALDSECPHATVAMPQLALRRCLVALIDNAIDHSPPQSRITVTGRRNRGTATVTVRDEGGGINGIERSRVFTRFARGTPPQTPRGKASTNQGLGLALVQELCEVHGGTIRVLSTGPVGTVFEMILPLGPSPSERGAR